MPTSNWEPLAEIKVSAKPDGIWTLICEDLLDFKKLKIVSNGKWTYSTKLQEGCSGNGDPTSPMKSEHCLYPQAPIGALIGKFGGSNMGVSDASIFVIGSVCIYEKAADSKTPHPCLFATINDLPDGFGDNGGELTVTVLKSR